MYYDDSMETLDGSGARPPPPLGGGRGPQEGPSPRRSRGGGGGGGAPPPPRPPRPLKKGGQGGGFRRRPPPRRRGEEAPPFDLCRRPSVGGGELLIRPGFPCYHHNTCPLLGGLWTSTNHECTNPLLILVIKTYMSIEKPLLHSNF